VAVMWKRWGPGPVFAYESLLNARRWQVYAGRSLFVVVILVGMTIVWVTRDHLASPAAARPSTYNQMAKIGEWFYYAMAGIQISLVMLAAPRSRRRINLHRPSTRNACACHGN